MTKKMLYIGVLVLLCICFSTIFGRYRYVDSYVSKNFARDIKDVQNIVNEMCLGLSYDGKYKYYSIEEMLEIVNDADDEVYKIAYRITEYSTLNENFDIRLFPVVDLITDVQGTLESEKKLSVEQLELLKELVDLNEEYSDLGNSTTYMNDSNTLTLMEMPEEVDAYIDKVRAIEREYNKLVL